MAELKIVCNPEYRGIIQEEYLRVSRLQVLSPEESNRQGYNTTHSILPAFGTSGHPHYISDKAIERLTISPDEVDPENPEIITLRLVLIPRLLGELALHTSRQERFVIDPANRKEYFTGIEASLRGFRCNPPGALSTSVDPKTDRNVALHSDSWPDDTVYLIANHASYSRWHCASAYSARSSPNRKQAQYRADYAQAHPPGADDELIWMLTPPHKTIEGLALDYAVVSPVTRALHDGSQHGVLTKEKVAIPRTSGTYFYAINPRQIAALPSPFYPRSDHDRNIYHQWREEDGILRNDVSLWRST
jgi:hypothetical protein